MSADKNLIIQGINLMSSNGKIDDSVKTDLIAYVGNISKFQVMECLYPVFDQVLSSGCTFNDETRTVIGSAGFELRTTLISLKDAILFGIKIDATDPLLDIQISDNGTDFYNIPDIDIYINQKTDFYLKFKKTTASTIKRFFLIYI